MTFGLAPRSQLLPLIRVPTDRQAPTSLLHTSVPVMVHAPDRSPRHRNVLRLRELHQPFVRTFASEAGLLDATERRGRIGDKPTIETDHAEVQFFRHAHAAA